LGVAIFGATSPGCSVGESQSRRDDVRCPRYDESRRLNSHLQVSDRRANAGASPTWGGRAVASQPEEETPSRRSLLEHASPFMRSLACVGIATAGLLLVDRIIPFNLAPIAYLVPVVLAATQWGRWPAIMAAIAGAAAADFFFFTPYYSFRIDDNQEVVDLLLFLFVAFVSSNLASRLRNETRALRQRETELQCLYDLSRRLAACFTIPDLIFAVQNYLSRALRQQTVFFAATADGHFEPPKIVAVPNKVQDRIASMVATIGLSAYTIHDEATGSVWLLRAVQSDATVHGVIAVNIGSCSPATIRTRTRRVEAILDEAALTLQRLDIGKAMADAKQQLQAQLLKDALHGMLSHELRSPMAAIQGCASVLESTPSIRQDDRLHALVEAISDEVQMLDGFIKNLINAARVTASGVRPRLEWADPKDIVNAALRLRSRRLAQHRVRVAFDDDLPLVHVDSALVEEACGQLLENAAKYSPSGSMISVVARAELAHVILSVSDRGVGITLEERDRLGQRSFRGQRHAATTPGSGLGFWIASTFIKANAGSITVSSRGEGLGTTASIVLPGSWQLSDLACADE
jgi:K+-sensing histidine kinase KdpD